MKREVRSTSRTRVRWSVMNASRVSRSVSDAMRRPMSAIISRVETSMRLSGGSGIRRVCDRLRVLAFVLSILHNHSMKYKVGLKKTEEGYSVWCPGLPGCWSQGKTEQEALDNIRDAIESYLVTAAELAGKA